MESTNQPQPTEAEALLPTLASRWSIVVTPADAVAGHALAPGQQGSFPLLEGRAWCLGQHFANDCVVLGADIAPQHLSLAMKGDELEITAIDRVTIQFRASGTSLTLPKQAHVTWPAGDLKSLGVGAWRVHLHAQASSQADTGPAGTSVTIPIAEGAIPDELHHVSGQATAQPAAARSEGPRTLPAMAAARPAPTSTQRLQTTLFARLPHRLGDWIALGLCGGAALLAAATWAAAPGPGALGLPALAADADPMAAGSPAGRLSSAGLGPGAQIHPPTATQRHARVTGVLRDEAACAAMRQVRQSLGADSFVSQAVCLPELLATAREFLSGTGVSVAVHGDGLRLQGKPLDAAATARVNAARTTLVALVAVDAEALDAGVAVTEASALAQQILPRIRSFSAVGGGWVALRGGETVYAGGVLAPGVTLVAVEEEALLVAHQGVVVPLRPTQETSR